jgi:hypothetical protein
MKVELNEWRVKIILEALKTLDEKWQSVIASTDDEDVKADYGNDLALLHTLREGFEEMAIAEYGSNITNFSRELI